MFKHTFSTLTTIYMYIYVYGHYYKIFFYDDDGKVTFVRQLCEKVQMVKVEGPSRKLAFMLHRNGVGERLDDTREGHTRKLFSFGYKYIRMRLCSIELPKFC